ncbi:MAG: chitobiase/beta-hexosaminidase C-terminal domain-containing protein [Spirochaetes bacterium]|nr:chitobiase/beta-hexosaminidase C-terminal domain-containing protein [Spirochaetota bacterium]
MSRILRILPLLALSLVLINCPSTPKTPKTAAAPTFSPAAGVYTTAQTVTISTTTEGAEIRYTTDGTDPSATNGTGYTGPVSVPATVTLKAIALKKELADSAVVGAAYTITGTVAGVTFSPAPGAFGGSVEVVLASSTPGAEIRYTTDGTNPTATTGSAYTAPVRLGASATVKAAAFKKDWAPSAVASAVYTVLAAVTDGEVEAVRGAIARAREFDAEIYDPDNLAVAKADLERGLAARTADPVAARAALADAKAAADLAYENSVALGAEDLGRRMEESRQRLLAQEADQWLPAEYESAVGGIAESADLFGQADYAGARSRAYQALKDMADLSTRLDERLRWVRMLRSDTEQLMAEAEATDAYAVVPAQKDTVNALYTKGVEDWQAYRLDDAEESFGAAREAARDTLRLAREAREGRSSVEKKKADELQAKAQAALKEAAGLTVANDEGEVVTPDEWTQFLQDIEKMELEYQKAVPHSMRSIPASGTLVLAEETSLKDLLEKAKEFYRLGLEEKAKGNYEQSQSYFSESLRYVEIYKSYAVKGVYVVRLIPERRDCLWRIAEYPEIYGDPYLWPKIWRRNRKLIQNPDLIYPGWQLVIPLQ